MTKKLQPTPTLDLRPITRDTNLCKTVVTLHWDFQEFPWIIAGQCQLRTDRKPEYLSLDARMDKATDREHDSAYAFKLPIIGLRFDHVAYHTAYFMAWINPNEPKDFHVPASTFKPEGYDWQHPETVPCPDCKGDDAHIVVPYFVPPADPEFFKLVRGKRVTIAIGPAYPEVP